MLNDVRLAVRFLRKCPVFSLVAILSLGIGIGASTAIFSVVNALLIRSPEGIGEPERVVELGRTQRGNGFDTFSYPDFLDYREAASLSGAAAWIFTDLSWSTEREAERVIGAVVSADYFEVLGVRAARGRFFLPEEDTGIGAHPVAIVSHRFWQERLGGDEVVGSRIALNRFAFEVVGVAPPEFRGHTALLQPAVYLPITMATVAIPDMSTEAIENRNSHSFMAVARLEDGTTLEEARAAVGLVTERIRSRFPETHAHKGADVMPLGMVAGAGRPFVQGFLIAIMALIGAVLAVACTNVAGMLLARGAAREKEIAIRLALGSSRGRLVRQLIGESLTLFIAGGGIGVGLAYLATRALESLPIPTPVPVTLDFSPDARVLAFGLAVALLTGLVFGLMPALATTRPALVPALKREPRGGSARGSWLRRAFVSGQVALSLVLVFGAALLLRAVERAAGTETGFDAGAVEMTSLQLALDGYGESSGGALQHALVERVRALPGAETAALAIDLPLDLASHGSAVYPEGWESRSVGQQGLGVDFNHISAGYFETLRIPVLRGRGFQDADVAESEPVCVVSRQMADLLWPNQNPVGRRLRFDRRSGPYRRVVGVVEGTPNQTITDDPAPMVYLPLGQAYRPDVHLLVRSATGSSLAGPLQAAIRELDPRLTTTAVLPLADRISLGVLPQRLAAGTVTGLAALALLLSAIGVYGVIAYTVTQRTRELGIRIAVGADPGRVRRMMLGAGVRLAAPGVLVGLVLSLGVGRLLQGFLLGMPGIDPLSLAAAPTVLLAAAVVAGWAPARRAARVQPMDALRVE